LEGLEGHPILLLTLGVAAVLVLLACIDQRKLWHYTRGWTADPAANQPSEAYFAFIRVSLVLLALGTITMGTWVWFAVPEDNEPTADTDYDTPTWDDETPYESEPDSRENTTALDLHGPERFERLDEPASPGPASPAPGPEGPAPREWDEALPATAETVGAILPDQAAMRPSLFTDQRQQPVVRSGAEAYACEAIAALCESLQAYGDVEYATPDGERVIEFQVLAYDSALAAQRALDGVKLYYAGSYYYVDVGPPLPPGAAMEADAMEAFEDYTTSFDGGTPRALIDLTRQGPYLGVVWQAASHGHASALTNPDTEIDLNELIAQRMGQAKRGEQPDAPARDGLGEPWF
jgi:hypothetical protein